MPDSSLINKNNPRPREEKSLEKLTFELMDYKEELDRSIQEYEDAVKRMKHKDRAWTLVTLAIIILVGFILVTSIGGIKVLLEQPEHVHPILWACLGCLLLDLWWRTGWHAGNAALIIMKMSCAAVRN